MGVSVLGMRTDVTHRDLQEWWHRRFAERDLAVREAR
jgi:hypothetical protein